MAEILRKQYNFEVKQLNDRVLRFTGSTETEDRDGEVIKVSGWQLDNYKKNPVFMWAHDYSQPPIGKAVNIHKRQGNLIFDIEFADKDTYEFADTIYKLYQGGFLHATSVGFIPDPEYITEGDGVKSPRRQYGKQELLELSAVPVPSNPDALRNAANKVGVSIKSIGKVLEVEENAVNKEIVMTTTNSVDDTVTTSAVVVNENIVINSPRVAKHSQTEIEDELDYLLEIVKENGLSDRNKLVLQELVDIVLRVPGSDIPAEIVVEAAKPKPKPCDDTLVNRIIEQTIKNVVNKS